MTIQNGICQEVTVFPGVLGFQYYEDSDRISKGEFETKLKSNKTAYNYLKKSKNYYAVALVGVGTGLGLSILGNGLRVNDTNKGILLVASLVSLGSSIGFSIYSSKLKKKSILNYNESLDVSSIRLGVTNNGFGFVCYL